jgi:hypothetical protein
MICSRKERDHAKKKICEFIKSNMPVLLIHSKLDLYAVHNVPVGTDNLHQFFQEIMAGYADHKKIYDGACHAKFRKKHLLSPTECEALENLIGDRWLMSIGQYLAICESTLLKLVPDYPFDIRNISAFYDEAFINNNCPEILSNEEFQRINKMLRINISTICNTIAQFIDANWQEQEQDQES